MKWCVVIDTKRTSVGHESDAVAYEVWDRDSEELSGLVHLPDANVGGAARRKHLAVPLREGDVVDAVEVAALEELARQLPALELDVVPVALARADVAAETAASHRVLREGDGGHAAGDDYGGDGLHRRRVEHDD